MRSIAIIDKLTDANYDVRLFVGRAALWRAYMQPIKNQKNKTNANKGVTTAIAVTSTLNDRYNIFFMLSHALERIRGDCQVAFQTKRYPFLIVSDGDTPGIIRARLAGVPSVAISHGQVFATATKPSYVKKDPRLIAAWNRQFVVNRNTGFFSNWQIATNFMPMETYLKTAVVARAPMRPFIIEMAQKRNHPPTYASESDVSIAEVLLYNAPTSTNTSAEDQEHVGTTPGEHSRKVVVAYFRDENGATVIEQLASRGFDVVAFEKGTRGGIGSKFKRWIIDEEQRKGFDFDVKAGRIKSIATKKTKKDPKKRFMQLQELAKKSLQISDPSGSRGRIIPVSDTSLFVGLMSIADGVVAS
eukprot:CAMPEP_0118725552 /NCGR_PEP_ID=MMETSP0800-20121206/33204_1 /TAXON_ID=210618 ORGANISM="Striatella unipunctata, Strain CCMP2910" /NCGR_SAMPLE_ID=MMETSP0800 /ASSEMBLY_ACC=CAM_ASM_000638 /LENGTH=357 /DNA_ID=CAMNT_0006634265 /DNA_START=179 /DNA_END=1249 /DNA_ORIENTATION=+